MQHDNQHHNNMNSSNKASEYLKFVGVMTFVIIGAYVWTIMKSLSLSEYLESFMGVFFVVFAGFKIFNLKEFAYGFQSYDLIARRSLVYSYTYPFIQLLLGIIYLVNLGSFAVNIAVIIISLISGAGVLNSILKKQKVHCVCLGNVIKLPLSTISFVEDFGMALMALVMIILM